VASTDAAAQRFCEHRHVRPTVVIVDDHAEFRAAARAVLEAGGFEVVGEAAGAAEAVAVAARLRPQIVLLDIQLPDGDGFAVAEELGEGPQVVLTSSRDARAYGRRLKSARVRGFIAKRELSGQALAALVV
jgi:DNA-binding NarL/FixJ family response regulator